MTAKFGWELVDEGEDDDLNSEETESIHYGQEQQNLELASITLIQETEPKENVPQTENNSTLEWALERAPILAEKGLKGGSKAVLDELIELLIPHGGCRSMLTMSLGYTAFITIVNGYSIAFRRRSKLRALKNIIDEGGSITVGNFVGYGAGLVAAFLFHTIPTLGVLGVSATVGFGASYFAHTFFDRLTLKLFQLPEDEELEKAHSLLEVKSSDTNSIVNRAYRQKARRFHPDSLTRRENPPSKEEMEDAKKEFLRVQEAMKKIREAREEDGWVFVELEKEELAKNEANETNWTDKFWNIFGRLNILPSGTSINAPSTKGSLLPDCT